MRFHNTSALIQLLTSIVLMTSGASPSLAGQTFRTDEMGLSKSSVFAVPEPKVAHYPATAPGESTLLPRAYLGAPPQVPHDVSEFLPITAQTNMCAACHNQPDLRGKKREKGAVVPIPASHYTDQRKTPNKVTENLVGARYNCNQCHVPQADAAPLVENTFSPGRAKSK